MPTIKFDDLLKEQLKDPKFREGYYEEQARLENAVAVPQSTIARIEKGANTSLSTMCKIAFALDKQVKISLV